MSQNRHIYAICALPEAASGVISSQNENTIRSYIFEVASLNSFETVHFVMTAEADSDDSIMLSAYG